MADEPVSTAAPSAPTAVSSPLSSTSPAPTASAAPTATPAAAASDPTPASPATTAPKTDPAAAARPEGLADRWWDPEKNALKVDPADLIERDKEFDRLRAYEAADQVRKNTLPTKVEDYKAELPPDFKLPPGVEYKLDAANPAIGRLKQVALKHQLSQAAVTEIIGVHAEMEVGTNAEIASAKAAEVARLGSNGPARIDAVLRHYEAVDPTPDKRHARAKAAMLVTAAQVEAAEADIIRETTQGTASFSTKHSVPPDTNSIPGYDKMSFEQRRHAQDQLAQQRRTN